MPVSFERPRFTPVQIGLRLALGAATVACAAAAGWMDLHGVDWETTLLFVVGISFVLAAVVPGWGALGGVLIGVGIPLARLYARVAGLHPDMPLAHATKGYYPLVAALVGIVTGLALRTGIAHARR